MVWFMRCTHKPPAAPESLNLIKRLFHYRLTELHQHVIEKENAFRCVYILHGFRRNYSLILSSILNNELNEIKSGAWDERIAPKKPEPIQITPASVASVPAAGSSSSSQLSSIDSPAHTPTVAVSAPHQGQVEMDVDEADVTITQKDDTMEAESEKAKSPPRGSHVVDEDHEDKVSVKLKEEDEDNEDEDEEDEEEEEAEQARPIRGLRSRKAPVLEPLEIPSNASTSRKGKGHKGA